MKQLGPGILKESEIYFTSVSPKAQKLFYNVLCAGHFYCDSEYHLARDNYSSILILHVIKGSFSFRNGQDDFFTALEGETVILDCFEPHEYFTKDNLESLWLHINGANSRELCSELTENAGNIISRENCESVKTKISEIFEKIRNNKGFSEENLTVEVYALLMELFNVASTKHSSDGYHGNMIEALKVYISAHLEEKITVAGLSEIAHMSPTHFSRVFRQYTGFSPYDYVINARLNKAKELLLKTDMSVAQIAYATGFNSQANFVYCFTDSMGVSPGKFRKTGF